MSEENCPRIKFYDGKMIATGNLTDCIFWITGDDDIVYQHAEIKGKELYGLVNFRCPNCDGVALSLYSDGYDCSLCLNKNSHCSPALPVVIAVLATLLFCGIITFLIWYFNINEWLVDYIRLWRSKMEAQKIKRMIRNLRMKMRYTRVNKNSKAPNKKLSAKSNPLCSLEKIKKEIENLRAASKTPATKSKSRFNRKAVSEKFKHTIKRTDIDIPNNKVIESLKITPQIAASKIPVTKTLMPETSGQVSASAASESSAPTIQTPSPVTKRPDPVGSAALDTVGQGVKSSDEEAKRNIKQAKTNSEEAKTNIEEVIRNDEEVNRNDEEAKRNDEEAKRNDEIPKIND